MYVGAVENRNFKIKDPTWKHGMPYIVGKLRE